MATFNINLSGTFVNGTAANDTFNIDAGRVTAFGLEGDDTFNIVNGGFFFIDMGAGNDSFTSQRRYLTEFRCAATMATTRCSSPEGTRRRVRRRRQ